LLLDRSEIGGSVIISPNRSRNMPIAEGASPRSALFGGARGDALKVAVNLEVYSTQIHGELIFFGAVVEGWVSLADVQTHEITPLPSHIVLTSVKCRSLYLGPCSIEGAVYAAKLITSDITVKGVYARLLLDLSYAQVDGAVLVQSVQLDGVDGNAGQVLLRQMQCRELTVQDVVVFGGLDLAFCEATGDMRLESVLAAPGATPSKHADDREAAGSGDFWVDAAYSRCRNLSCANVWIGGDFNLTGLRCLGFVRLWTNESGSSPHVFGNLIFDICEVSGEISIETVSVGGVLMMNGAKCGSLVAYGQGQSSSFGAINVVDTVFSSYVGFADLTVKGSVKSIAATADRAPAFEGIYFRSSTFADGLSFWRSSREEDVGTSRVTVLTAWGPACGHCSVKGSVTVTDCAIKGDLDLTRLVVLPLDRQERSDVEGGITLDRTTVTGDVYFSSPQGEISHGAGGPITRAALRWVADPSRRQDIRASASFLQMLGLRAENIYLTGLTIRGSGQSSDDAEGGRAGMILAERVQVPGSLVCFTDVGSAVSKDPSQSPAASRQAHVDVPGALILERAHIGDLVISARSFEGQKTDEPRRKGIVLEHASVAHLRVPRLPHDDRTHGRGFPIPLDLFGLKVGAWSFELDDDRPRDHSPRDDRSTAEDYLAILLNDRRLHRDLYRVVYKSLHDVGSDAQARLVFVEEHRRAYDESRKAKLLTEAARPVASESGAVGRWVRRVLRKSWFTLTSAGAYVWDRIDDRLLNYGLSPKPLIVVIFALFVLSLLGVAREPANFELSEAARGVMGNASKDVGGPNLARGVHSFDDYEVLGPRTDEWGWADAFWMTVRYHIPLVGLVARSDYAPTHERGIEFAVGSQVVWPGRSNTGEPVLRQQYRWRLLGVTPEDWLGLMALVNWMLWPLFLAYAVRRAFRGSTD
jgi:hypothetical protein